MSRHRHALRSWQVLVPESDLLPARLTGDWVRVVAASVFVTLSALHVGDETSWEQAANRFFAELPGGARGAFEAIERLGALWAVGLLVLILVVRRRWRLGAVIASSAVVAWFLARFIGFVVLPSGSVGGAIEAVFNGTDVAYPVVPLALLTAVVSAARPFLVRPARRTGTVLLALVAVGSLYRTVGTINAVVAALVLGWGVAAVAHLVFGSPAGWPAPDKVAAALEELGVGSVESIELLPNQPRGCRLMTADMGPGHAISVRVYGRDAADTRLASKVWRFVMYKDSGPALTLTRLQQVEHEALCLIVAREGGVRVPAVVAIGQAGTKDALLVTDRVEGSPITENGIADEQLRDLWQQVDHLRQCRIAHGALDVDRVSMTREGAVIVDFPIASLPASKGQLDQDVAQLLTSTALLVGARRATSAAVAGVGRDAVAAALPFVQKPPLTRSTRARLRTHKDLLNELHAEIGRATGVENPEPVEIRRVKPLTVLMVLGLLFALWVVLGQVGSISNLIDTLAGADWAWVVMVAIFSQSAQLSYAIATVGSVDNHVPYGPAVLMQYSVAFTNMVAPSGLASALMNIRFLQKTGASVAVATSSGVIIGLSGTVASFSLFVVTAIAVGQSASISEAGDGSNGRLILIGVFVAAVLIGIVAAIPRLRRTAREKWWPAIADGFRNLWTIASSPRKLVMVFGGALGAQILYSLSLGAALAAYGAGGELNLAQLIFVNTSVSFVASLTPVPGGMGVTEAGLIAGLTAFGIPGSVASAAVITHRLFTTYLPPIPGSYATKWLVSNGYL